MSKVSHQPKLGGPEGAIRGADAGRLKILQASRLSSDNLHRYVIKNLIRLQMTTPE
jgi:hypothetical protein